MKIQYVSVFQRMASILRIVIVITAVTTAHATTHIIQFGGSFGLTYSPNALNVAVGDTIEWEGDFSMHPLSSTSVPAGAQSFHQGSGNVFLYPVSIEGTYLYRCDFHYSAGMTGSFTANITTGVVQDQTSLLPDGFILKQNFPNPFNPTTMILFDLPIQTFVSVKVYDLRGHEVTAIVNENMAAGSYSKAWHAASLPSGVYFYQMQAGGFIQTKKMLLLK